MAHSMSPHQTRQLAIRIRKVEMKGWFTTQTPKPDPHARSLEHAFWMLDQIATDTDMDYDKQQRWIGYAQALLVVHQKMDTQQMRDLVREAKLWL